MAAAIPWMIGASAAVSAIGAIRQGQAQQAASEFNAQVDAQNAQIARQDAAQQAAQQDRENRLRLGAIRAAQGASGGTGSSDNVFNILGDAAAQGELAKQNILYQGELKARGYKNTQSLDIASGKNAMTAGTLKAGSELLSGGANAYMAYKRLN